VNPEVRWWVGDQSVGVVFYERVSRDEAGRVLMVGVGVTAMGAAKYYAAYEDRYRRVYAQGVEYWTGDPDEIGGVVRCVDEFLDRIGARASSSAVVEFGCGEGFLGAHLLSKGFGYLGVDLSPSAIAKAQRRVCGNEACFVCGDVTDLGEVVASGSFDIGLDNYCLHMLVTDEDRRKYLSEMRRVLKPGGFAWFHEIGQDKRFEGPVASVGDFVSAEGIDLDTCEPREAYTPAGRKTVYLPRLPARFNSGEGYGAELSEAGFCVEYLEVRKSGVVMHAKRLEE